MTSTNGKARASACARRLTSPAVVDRFVQRLIAAQNPATSDLAKRQRLARANRKLARRGA